MSNVAEETKDVQQPRSSSRERIATEKGQVLQEDTVKRQKEGFIKAYESWKRVTKEARTKLKAPCSRDDLNTILNDSNSSHDSVCQYYESLRRNHAIPPEFVKKMDACGDLTKEVKELVEKRLTIVDEPFSEEREKLRVRMALCKETYGSIFGNTETETVLSRKSSAMSDNLSRASSKRADAEAELAAQNESEKTFQDVNEQREHLRKLEKELKLKEAEMLAEMKGKLEKERAKLHRIETEREVRIAQARVRAYQQYENDYESRQGDDYCTDECEEVSSAEVQTPHKDPNNLAAASLAEAIASSISINRLPVPEPRAFSGDPLKFTEWKLSFMMLIDNKPLSPNEKMFYLKTYLSGEARKAVEGYFFRDSEEAYKSAWLLLQERYGDPFIVKRAFRDKLAKWPKISANDPLALREFGDFLQGCVEAIPHVKGLSVLNDCEENHKLVKKLPEWLIRKWNRVVVESLDTTGDCPSFAKFTSFIRKEARIACNPITSPYLLNSKTVDERSPRRAKSLNVNTTNLNKGANSGNQIAEHRQRAPCYICKDVNHGIAKCPVFATKSTAEKKQFIQTNNLCFGCLKRGHSSKECRTRHICGVCGRCHPTCLHENRVNINTSSEPVQSAQSPPERNVTQVNTATSHAATQHTCATTSIVPVFVSSLKEPNKEILTYALLDTQSDSTFVLEELAQELSDDVHPVQLKLSTLTAVDTLIKSNTVGDLQIRGLSSETQIPLHHAYTRDFIPVDKSYIPTGKTALQWPHLRHLASKLPALQSCEVGLLIGYDCPWALAPQEIVAGGRDEPFAQRTELGWTIIGSSNPHLDRQGNQRFVHRVTVKEIPTPPVTDVLKALEHDFNERSYEDKFVSQDDVRFIQLLSDSIIQEEDGHYEMPLPYKGSNPPMLPNNKKLASIRLQSLKRKLKTNKRYHEQYNQFMEEIIQRGDANPASTPNERDAVWYIPHHGVYHPKKPDKLRVVFDCSARYCGVSLNENLLPGPDLINSLVGVLCRFRKNNVAIICDIEKMFHQFRVSPEHRNYLRFLWWKDGDLDGEPKEYQMAVHLFGATSSPGCANFGFKHLARQHKYEYPVAANFIERNFYVDDGLTSVPTIEEAKMLITESQELCKRGGLHLHKFNLNRKEVLECVDPSERTTSAKHLDLNLDATPSERALGIQWSVKNDTFSFCVDLKQQPINRRGVLSIVASLYDPLGFVSPFILTARVILQELCRRSIGWDDPLPEDLISRWEDWTEDLKRLKEISIPRCYHPSAFGNIVKTELHHFSDASNTGYGACSYLRLKNEREEVFCSLVMAKSRVAPSKITSIPRLELSAAVISAKLSVLLKDELEMQIDEEFFWSDSQVVLAYISNEARRFHVFVANRVQQIRERSEPSQWHYVETTENPADHASRGLPASEIASSTWLSGPKFLWEQEVHEAPNISPELLVGDPEVKKVQVFKTESKQNENFLDSLNQFSAWSKLTKVIARIKRLGSKENLHSSIVTAKERDEAASVVIRLVQQQAFFKELEIFRKGGSLPSTSCLYCLDPILCDGLLRVGGRLKHLSVCEEMKHPVILPRNSHITDLIVSHYHRKIHHQGRIQTQMELRANGFWVMGGSKLVAKLIRNCVLCRKLRRPLETQMMAELPKERVAISAPLTYTDMDCFGPFLVKRARKEYKRYGLIFTCFSSRAVHIEMLEDLSTDAFINALRCFISLRGAVSQLHCDQGSNFIGAKNEFKQALKQCDVKALENSLSEKQCEFVFNAPSSSHAGGVWERQIRTIRNILNATLAQFPGRLDDSSLRTLFYEAMAIINSRPLTVQSINDPRSLEPLTPNHLLMMKSKVALPPPGKFVKEDVFATKRWRRVQYLTEQFWSRWRKEYIANIATRQKWHTRRRNLKENDIVIIQDDTSPRNKWRLGRVVETTKDSDGLVRRARIQVGDQSGKGNLSGQSVLERPIQKLVVLLEAE